MKDIKVTKFTYYISIYLFMGIFISILRRFFCQQWGYVYVVFSLCALMVNESKKNNNQIELVKL